MNHITALQKQQNVKPKRPKRSKFPGDTERSQEMGPKSRAKYLQDLRQDWENAP